MANENRTATALEMPQGVAWEASMAGIYRFNPNATQVDILDQLQARVSHLTAMLAVGGGVNGLALDAFEDSTKSGFIWACESVAAECRELTTALDLARTRDREEVLSGYALQDMA